MLFGEKLRTLRLENNMTLDRLAGELLVTKRTLINYEQGKCYPKQTEIYGRIAGLFNVSADYLMSDEDYYISEAEKKGGQEAKRDVEDLITQVGGLFAGGELSEADKDKVLRKITELYWEAKEGSGKK